MHMMGRLGERVDEMEVTVKAEVMDTDDPEPAPSLQSMLEQALDEVKNSEAGHSLGASGINFSKSSRMAQAIRKELENLPVSGRTGMVALSYSWLKGIVPTSVESERVFSTVGNIVTKVRSSLGDETVDALCFLKCYYRTK